MSTPAHSKHGRRAAAPLPKSRHRAPDPVTDPANTSPLDIIRPGTGTRRKATHVVSVTTGSLALIGAASGFAVVQSPAAESAVSEATSVENVLIAAPDVPLAIPRTLVQTTPAPPPPAPEPVAAPAPEPVAAPAPAVEPEEVYVPAPRQAPPPPVRAPLAAPAAPPPPPPPPPLPKAQRILSAAMGQLGRAQDCTMLVTNSLAAVGISFHDWPVGYFSLGYQVPMSQAIPGDLLYYANGGAGVAHIAVYAGNGMAVHGGFNGNETRLFSANVGSGPVAIRVN